MLPHATRFAALVSSLYSAIMGAMSNPEMKEERHASMAAPDQTNKRLPVIWEYQRNSDADAQIEKAFEMLLGDAPLPAAPDNVYHHTDPSDAEVRHSSIIPPVGGTKH
jgi:hypothetical protein